MPGSIIPVDGAGGLSTFIPTDAMAPAAAANGPMAMAGMLFNGATFDRPRTPFVFKTLSAVVITSETTVWTPATGKKFRLMGFMLAQGVATGAVTFKDNTAGTTIFIMPAHTVGVGMVVHLGNGILSAAANNVLTATGVSTETLTGTIFGTEE